MTLKGEKKVGSPDTFPIVGDTDESPASVLDVDDDVPAAGVEAVFDQFLDDRSRPFDHFSGGDPADHVAGKHLNGGGRVRSGHRITLPTPSRSSDLG